MSAATRHGSVLVTGATGVLGTEIVTALRRAGWEEVIAVARRPARDGTEIIPWRLGEEAAPASLQRHWDAIVNAAADTRWTLPAEQAWRANVTSLESLLPLVGPWTRFLQVSTAYAGGRRNDVSSPELGDYRNTYEWSKAGAERLVAEAVPGAQIVRPTLIIGRRADGQVARFNGVYALLRGIVAGTIPAIVTLPSSYLDLVPADELATLIAQVLPDPGDATAPLTVAGGDSAPYVEDAVRTMIEELNRSRVAWGSPALELPKAITPESWDRFFRPFFDRYLSPRQRRIIELLRNYEPYLQITEPIPATHRVTDILPCLAFSVRYWAAENRRVACMPAHRWKLNPEHDDTAVVAR